MTTLSSCQVVSGDCFVPAPPGREADAESGPIQATEWIGSHLQPIAPPSSYALCECGRGSRLAAGTGQLSCSEFGLPLQRSPSWLEQVNRQVSSLTQTSRNRAIIDTTLGTFLVYVPRRHILGVFTFQTLQTENGVLRRCRGKGRDRTRWQI
jgi:hypothetical protein